LIETKPVYYPEDIVAFVEIWNEMATEEKLTLWTEEDFEGFGQAIISVIEQ